MTKSTSSSSGEDVHFFKNPPELRAWFELHALKKDEAWIGFYKKHTRKESITWSESVDEALCYGWIDGIRKSLGDDSYKIRFTPRRKNSHWSKVNLDKVALLLQEGRMKKAGKEAYEARDENNMMKASFEQPEQKLPGRYLAQFNLNTKAKSWFDNQAPSYKIACTHWIMTAKQEKTQQKRLEVLISCSIKNEKIPPLRWSSKK